jgi:hypothetical protein
MLWSSLPYAPHAIDILGVTGVKWIATQKINTLLSGDTIMRRIVLALALAVLGCADTVAPPGSSLLLFADRDTLRGDLESATLRIIVREESGDLVRDGTRVHVFSTKGLFCVHREGGDDDQPQPAMSCSESNSSDRAAIEVTTVTGTALLLFRSGSQRGAARVHALSGDAAAEVGIQLEELANDSI